MVEMDDAEDHAQWLAQLQKQQQQGHGVGTSGNRRCHTVAGAHEFLGFDDVQQLLA